MIVPYVLVRLSPRQHTSSLSVVNTQPEALGRLTVGRTNRVWFFFSLSSQDLQFTHSKEHVSLFLTVEKHLTKTNVLIRGRCVHPRRLSATCPWAGVNYFGFSSVRRVALVSDVCGGLELLHQRDVFSGKHRPRVAFPLTIAENASLLKDASNFEQNCSTVWGFMKKQNIQTICCENDTKCSIWLAQLNESFLLDILLLKILNLFYCVNIKPNFLIRVKSLSSWSS